MKRTQPYILLFLISQLVWVFPAAAVDRLISEQDTCSPLVNIQVVPSGVTSWQAEETLPGGLTPANIKGRGIWDKDNRTIVWGPFYDTTTRNLSYEITGNSGSYVLSGIITFDGTPQVLEGNSQADIFCTSPLEQVARPQLLPVSGTFTPLSVTLSCATANAEIRYTTDGSVPSAESDLFSSGTPIEINSQTSLRGRAFAMDMLDSDVVSARYPDSASPAPGTLMRSVSSGGTCSPVVAITVTADSGVNAYAVQETISAGLSPSNISHDGLFDPDLGLIKWGPFSDNTGRTLTYEITGPDQNYVLDGMGSFDGIPVPATGDTQAAVTCHVAVEQVATPVFNPASGATVPVTLTLSCATVDAEIRYTIDGTVPDSTDLLYDDANQPVFSSPVNIRARAFKTGMLASDTAHAGYVDPDFFITRSRTITGSGSCNPLTTLAVSLSGTVQSYSVEERLPDALWPVNINENGTWDSENHTIKWGPFNDSTARAFSYNVQGPSGTYGISGVVSANGKSAAVTGDRELVVSCAEQVAFPAAAPSGGTPVPVSVSLSCATAGAEIRYTTDGSDPDLTSDLYTNPLDFVDQTILKARAFKTGMAPSGVFTATYPKNSLTRTITNSDTCFSSVSITMTPVDPFDSWAVEEVLPVGTWPANITENGVWDSAAHKIKWGPFNDTAGRTLTYELNGYQGGFTLEGVGSYDGSRKKIIGDDYAIIHCGDILEQASAPVFAPVSGSEIPVMVSMTTTTPDAVIRYTTDGSAPDAGSDQYTEPIDILIPTSLRAIALKAGMRDSAVTSAVYPAPAPADPGAAQRTVTDNGACHPAVSILVTPEPSVQSYCVTEKLASGITVDAINENGVFIESENMIKWGPFNDDAQRTFTYGLTGPNFTIFPDGTASFNGKSIPVAGEASLSIVCSQILNPVATPVFFPASGSRVPVDVSLSCATPDADIYFTNDGTVPNETSSLYQGPIPLSEASSFRARAFKTGMAASETVSASYKTASPVADGFEREIMLDNTCYPIIRMRVVPISGDVSWAAEENIPVGLTPSRINNSGVWDASLRKIKWGPFVNGETRTLMYNLTGSDGTYSITGYLSINGRQEAVAGSGQITILCIDADFDEDGIPDSAENLAGNCLGTADSDSDDDGILDGLEDANQNGVVDPGETDPCNPDTDGDGIQDGTETGLIVADLWGDTDLAVFEPDTDPSTTTDATDPDTDGDGYYDGEEMRMGSDPNDSADICVYTPATYVLNNSTGNDLSGSGSAGSPWRTLHHVLLRINGGIAGNYTIQMEAGTYDVSQGETIWPLILTQSNITLTGAGIGSTILSGIGGGAWTNGLEISGNDITISEMSFRNFTQSGIRVVGQRITIDHCEVSGNLNGVMITGAGGDAMITGNCNIFQNSNAGILIDGTSNNFITDNVASIFDNGIGISITAGATDNLVQNNNIYWSGDPLNTQSIGILVDNAGTGNRLISNTIHDHNAAGYYGIQVINSGPDIFQNMMYDNDTGIHLSSNAAAPSPRVWNNLLYDASGGMQYGIYLVNQPGGTLIPEIFHNTLTGGVLDGINNNGSGADPVIKYNIISDFGQYGINNNLGTPEIDYNDIFNNLIGNYIGWAAGGNDISVDPDFVGAPNYHLNPTSGCIDQIPLTAGDPVTEDLGGTSRPLDAGYDMGCYESPDTVAPTIATTIPSNNVTGVALTAAISAYFSEPMNPATITVASFTVSGASGNIAGTVSYSGMEAVFTPLAPLEPGTTYAAVITSDAQDQAGNSLAGGYSWSFTTVSIAPPPDTVAPTVTTTIPTNNATGVALTAAISAYFSEALNPSTITGASFTVSGSSGNIAGTVSYSGMGAVFTPSAPLEPGTTYVAVITSDAQDQAGNSLAGGYSWSFTTVSIAPPPDTVAPTVTTTIPTNNATGVALTAAISVYFSEALNPATITGASFTVSGPLGNIAGTVSYSGMGAVFTPSAPLELGTTYTAVISSDVEDQAGNSLTGGYAWSFTTVSIDPPPDIDEPTVMTTSPLNNAIDVALTTTISVYFSEALNPATITGASFTVSGPLGNIAGTVTYSEMGAVFKPSAPLDLGTTYTAVISSDIEDQAGNSLTGGYAWSFTTVYTDITEPVNHKPDTPTSEIGDNVIFDSTTVLLEASPYSDFDNDAHIETYWQIRRKDAMTYDPPITTGTNTQCTINGLLEGVKYVWRVAYEDQAGDISWSQEYEFVIGTSTIDSTVRTPPGIFASDYKMVSVVQWPENPSIVDIVGDLVALNYFDYQIGTYDPIAETYIVSGHGLNIEPGRAYWILAKNGLDVSVKGVPVSLTTDIDVNLYYNSLEKNGWNMIACPNHSNYLWADIEMIAYDNSGNIISGPTAVRDLPEDNPYLDLHLWRWENNSYFADTALMEAYKGYWVRTKTENIYLRFGVSAQTQQETLEKSRKAITGIDAVELPPHPMKGLENQNADSAGDGSSGCFISELLY